MQLSEKLKKARISKKLTQQTLAESLGVSRATISMWESGNAIPNISYLLEYQKIFGFEKGYFDEYAKNPQASENISLNISELNALGRFELEKFYNSLIKNKEYLKKP